VRLHTCGGAWRGIGCQLRHEHDRGKDKHVQARTWSGAGEPCLCSCHSGLLGELDDVRPKAGADDAELIELGVLVEAIVIEGPHHRTWRKGAQIATLGRAGTGRVLLGCICERDLARFDLIFDEACPATVGHEDVGGTSLPKGQEVKGTHDW